MINILKKLKRDKFDYTEWQREYFDKMAPEQIQAEAIAYEKAHPFKLKKRK